jgi:pyruvate carboxylase
MATLKQINSLGKKSKEYPSNYIPQKIEKNCESGIKVFFIFDQKKQFQI